MSKPKIYIDGKEGTTGLQIYDRLADRRDVELLLIDERKRKDLWERKRMFDAADIVFLCLPDDAAKEIVDLAEKPTVRLIDCSTAHRTAKGWAYGFPELSKLHRAKIRDSRRVANPGCHASGFISIVYPLAALGLLPHDAALTAFSLTGYSGGGKKMIAQYEGPDKTEGMLSPRIYGLNLRHKHLPEMQAVCGLKTPPVFLPVVDDFYKGMAVTVPFQNSQFTGKTDAKLVWEALSAHYSGKGVVRVAPFGWEEPMIAANTLAGKDTLTLIVNGNETQTAVTALFDNLGKGASGAAVQNMNLMLGFDELTGLNL